jgi:hypothetical protein
MSLHQKIHYAKEVFLVIIQNLNGPEIEETSRFANQTLCHNCASNHTSSGSFCWCELGCDCEVFFGLV